MPKPTTPSWKQNSKTHLRLAWPLCLGQVGQQLMALVDSAMVGHYDKVALAGFGIANTLLFTVTFFGVGIVLGLDSLIPQAIGRGDQKEARSLYRSGLRLAIQIGIPLTLVAGISPLFLNQLGVQADIATEAKIYLFGRLPALLPFLIFTANSSYLQAIGLTRPIVYSVVIGNLVNLVADGVLVFGDDALVAVGLGPMGLPALGGLGASLSTCIVGLVMTAVLSWAVWQHKIPGAAAASRDMVRKIRIIGLPIGLQLLAEVGIFAIAGIMAGHIGVVATAAHQVALTLASVTFSAALGMGAATSVLVGQAVGRGSHREARAAGLTGLFWGVTIMLVAGMFFVIAPRPLAAIISSDVVVIQAAIPLLAIAALFQLSDAIQAVLAGALRGAGDTRATFVGNLIGHYGVGIWVALLLGFVADLGAIGIWWGLSAGLTVTAIGLAWRFWTLTSEPIPPV